MAEIKPNEVIQIILETVETTYGNLGFLSFKLHSIRANTKEGVYVVKYSFIPRTKEGKRIFYIGKVSIKDRNMFEINETTEKDLFKDDN